LENFDLPLVLGGLLKLHLHLCEIPPYLTPGEGNTVRKKNISTIKRNKRNELGDRGKTKKKTRRMRRRKERRRKRGRRGVERGGEEGKEGGKG
jgi:hypothetical protein